MKVFLTDLRSRKAVPIARSLGRRGIDVSGGELVKFPLGSFSKYCSGSICYPCPEKTPERFIDVMLSYFRREPHDVLFPLNNRALMACLHHRDALGAVVRVPLPATESVLITMDKRRTMEYAKRCGVPHPQTYDIHDIDELKSLQSALTYPVVIKPRYSAGSRGIVYVHDPSTLSSDYEKVNREFPSPLIQEWIPGGGDALGVSLLFDKDTELKAAFVHKRLREYPVTGGPSTLRESIRNDELIEMSVKLMKGLKWYGVAMVEYKVDPRNGIPKLLEVNPRFWGSIQLAIVSGVDFPYLLYKVAMDEDFAPVVDYQVGVRCRWLSGDIFHFLTNPNRFKMEPSFFNFWARNTYYDLLSWEDPGPIFGLAVEAVRNLISPQLFKAIVRRTP